MFPKMFDIFSQCKQLKELSSNKLPFKFSNRSTDGEASDQAALKKPVRFLALDTTNTLCSAFKNMSV